MKQLDLWEQQEQPTQRLPLGSTFQKSEPGTNPHMFLGKIGSNFRDGMNIHTELYYWHCIKSWREDANTIVMLCKVIGYAGNGRHEELDTDTEEEEDDE